MNGKKILLSVLFFAGAFLDISANQPLPLNEVNRNKPPSANQTDLGNIPRAGSFDYGRQTFYILDGVYMADSKEMGKSKNEKKPLESMFSSGTSGLANEQQHIGSLFGSQLYWDKSPDKSAIRSIKSLSGNASNQNEMKGNGDYLVVYNPVTHGLGLVRGDIKVRLKQGVSPTDLEKKHEIELLVSYPKTSRGKGLAIFKAKNLDLILDTYENLLSDPEVDSASIIVKQDNLSVF